MTDWTKDYQTGLIKYTGVGIKPLVVLFFYTWAQSKGQQARILGNQQSRSVWISKEIWHPW